MFRIEMLARGAICATMLFAASLAGAQQYTPTNIGSFGGTLTLGASINSVGQVTGYSTTSASGLQHVFLYSNGTMQDLGTSGTGSDINASGQIAGYFARGADNDYAFSYSNGSIQNLGTLGGNLSVGRGINELGQITGDASIAANSGWPWHAFLYSNGSMQDLGTLGGAASGGNDINEAGQVTGRAATAFRTDHAFLYSNGSMRDLGTLGGANSAGIRINASGQITGEADTSNGTTHAFFYSDGLMQDLGTFGGAASIGYGINFSGQITGSADTASGAHRAFLFSNGMMTDLNTLIDPASPLALYVTLTEATAINDSGWIVANGIDRRTGGMNAYLLSPSSVPLPAAGWLLFSGLGCLIFAKSRKASAPSTWLPVELAHSLAASVPDSAPLR